MDGLILCCLVIFIIFIVVGYFWFNPVCPKKIKVDRLNILKQNKSEISKQKNIICIGDRSGDDVVRAIKLKDYFVYPPYGQKPKWQLFDENHILINGIKINNAKVRDTRYQCWSWDLESKEVTIEEFNNYLKKLSFKPIL